MTKSKKAIPAAKIPMSMESYLASKIAITCGKNTTVKFVKNITIIDTENGVVVFHFLDKTAVKSEGTITENMARMPEPHFVLCHQSTAVNINNVVSHTDGDGGELEFSNGVKTKISRPYKTIVVAALHDSALNFLPATVRLIIPPIILN